MRRSADSHLAAESITNDTPNMTDPAANDTPDDLAATDRSTEQQADTHFRFLDLPAEIRNRVYAHALSNCPIRDLSCFALPPFALTTRQLRNEALPILFAESQFRLSIGCNLLARDYSRLLGHSGQKEKNDRRLAGVPGIKRIVGSFLKGAGEAALLRDISIQITDAQFIEEARDWERCGRPLLHRGLRYTDRIKATLHLLVTEGSLSMSVKETSCSGRYGFPRYIAARRIEGIVQDIEGALEKASSIAREIANKDGFKGFTISDLRSVAKAFRLD